MSNLAQFVGGYGPIATVVNYFSAGGNQSSTALTASDSNNCKEYLSGAPGAGVLSAALVNVAGRGRLNLAAAYTKDASPRTVRLQIVVDGVTIFDATSSSVSTTGRGIVGVGCVDVTNGAQAFQPVDFYQSLVIKIANSLNETDKVALGANYETWA